MKLKQLFIISNNRKVIYFFIMFRFYCSAWHLNLFTQIITRILKSKICFQVSIYFSILIHLYLELHYGDIYVHNPIYTPVLLYPYFINMHINLSTLLKPNLLFENICFLQDHANMFSKTYTLKSVSRVVNNYSK